MTLIKYEYMALETGMLATQKVAQLKLKGKLINDPEEEQDRRATSSNRTCAVERVLRNSAQNAVVLSVLMLGEKWHQSLVRAVVRVSEPVHLWHRRQNHAHRSAPDSVQWCAEQLGGRLRRCHPPDSGTIERRRRLGVRRPRLRRRLEGPLEADELAGVFGGLSLALAGRRWSRCLFMLRGWPFRLVAVLAGGDLQTRTLAEFRNDYLAYKALVGAPGKTAAMKSLIRRSCFGGAAVEQWVKAASLRRWLYTISLGARNALGVRQPVIVIWLCLARFGCARLRLLRRIGFTPIWTAGALW